MLECELSWRTEAAAQGATGLAKAGDRLCAPRPAAPGKLFQKIFRYVSLSDELTRALRVSWTSLLRVQSECLPLVRQLATESMDADSAALAPTNTGM